jgi:AcrR family transcriptional regulator
MDVNAVSAALTDTTRLLEECAIDTRERILNAAIDLYLAHGTEATSLRHIADELGVTKAALYYHFPSKRDLIYSIVAPVLEGMQALLEKLETAPMVSATEVLETYFDFTVDHLKIYQMMIRNPGILVDLEILPTFMEWRRRFEVLLVGQDASPEDRVRATVAFGGVSDCIVMLAGMPVDELRALSIAVACDTLAVPRP